MPTPEQNVDAGLGHVWGSDFVQKNPVKSYKSYHGEEYAAVAAYLNGGPRPDPASYSDMGKGLVELEDGRRQLVVGPTGATGATGPTGATGATGASGAPSGGLPPTPQPTHFAQPNEALAKLNSMAPGDCLELQGGTHPQLSLSKSFGAPGVTVTARAGTKIAGVQTQGQDGYTFDRIESERPFSTNRDDSCFYFVGDSKRIRLWRSKLTGGCITIKVYVSAPAWVEDCEVVECDSSGGHDTMHINGARRLLVDHSKFHDHHFIPGAHHDGIQVTRAQKLTISRFRIWNPNLESDSQGILIGEAAEPSAVEDVLIVNGLIGPFGKPGSGCIGLMISHTTRCKVVNNTVVDTGSYGFNATPSQGPVIDTEVWNNIFQSVFFNAPGLNVPGGTLDLYDTNHFIQDQGTGSTGYVRGSNATFGDPKFVDRISYELQASSPCRSRGLTRAGTPTHDFDGNPRPAVPGLGAKI